MDDLGKKKTYFWFNTQIVYPHYLPGFIPSQLVSRISSALPSTSSDHLDPYRACDHSPILGVTSQLNGFSYWNT